MNDGVNNSDDGVGHGEFGIPTSSARQYISTMFASFCSAPCSAPANDALSWNPGCWVHVRINWDTAHLEPNGASVYFFPQKDGTPYVSLC
jgi:hypothetical protein